MQRHLLSVYLEVFKTVTAMDRAKIARPSW